MKPKLNSSGKYHKGHFHPVHPEKYMGNPDNILYRSGWEFFFMRYLDNHPQIRKWCSEGAAIRYRDIEGNIHRYYPDFYYEKTDPKDDTFLDRVLVEIKPKAETERPIRPVNETRTALKSYHYESQTYIKNMLKWEAVTEFCRRNQKKFILVTEDHLVRAGILPENYLDQMRKMEQTNRMMRS